MTSLELKIIRLLTNNETMNIRALSTLINRHMRETEEILKEFEQMGYLARLDYNEVTLTR